MTDHHGLASEAIHQWTWEPFTVALLLLSAVIYTIGVAALWRRAGTGRGIKPWQAGAFAAGLASLAVALLSPLDWLSDILFSAHMAQHEILMLVSAPLLVFGHPLLAATWALPRARREAWSRWSGRAGATAAWRRITAPLTVFVLHAVAIWIWHAPVLWDAALGNEGIHAMQHLSFVLTGALFWWAMVHGRYGRMGYGLGVLYVFLTAVHTSVLGALMAVSPNVWYAAYSTAAGTWHLDALEDQQLAGLIMWVPSSVIFIVFGLALFAAWLGESGKRAALGSIPLAMRGALDSRSDDGV